MENLHGKRELVSLLLKFCAQARRQRAVHFYFVGQKQLPVHPQPWVGQPWPGNPCCGEGSPVNPIVNTSVSSFSLPHV